MTPACKLLQSKKITFSVHEYEHDANAKSFGLEAAEKLNLAVHEVFKTLLVTDDKNHFVAVLPVQHQLNLKKWQPHWAAKNCTWLTRKMLNASQVTWSEELVHWDRKNV